MWRAGVLLALPYALKLLLLAAGAGRIRAPAADGVPTIRSVDR